MNRPLQKTGSQKARNSAARLLAVQAVYQSLKNGQVPQTLIAEFLDHRTGIDPDGDEIVSPNIDLFSNIINNLSDNFDQLKEMVDRHRQKKTEMQTDLVLQAVFLCGACELMMKQSTDAGIIIADYLHVTEAFYEKNEVRLVNGVLDAIKKTVHNA